MQASESTVSTQVDSKLSSSKKDEVEITNSVRDILEESQQIAELIEMENAYSMDIVKHFSEITSTLKESYHIKPESVAKGDSSVTDAVLTPKGILLIFHESKLVTSSPLQLVKCENLIKILEETIPKVGLLLKEKRLKISQRVLTLEKVTTEIKKVVAVDSRQEPEQSSRISERHPR